MQLPNPPNVTVTALGSNFVKGMLTEVENATEYVVTSKKLIIVFSYFFSS